jgi:hypothetical protein
MRLRLIAVTLGSLLVSAPVYATGISYTFTGTMSRGSTLTLGDGTAVDLSFAAFTATGMTGDLSQPDYSFAWYATTTYDFGALGSFTTNVNGDQYLQWLSPTLAQIGLASWRVGYPEEIGFMVVLDTITSAADLQPTGSPVVLGNVTITQSSLGYTRTLMNAAGETLLMQRQEIRPGLFSVDSASIVATPEPDTLALIALGVGFVMWHRRTLSTHS